MQVLDLVRATLSPWSDSGAGKHHILPAEVGQDVAQGLLQDVVDVER